MADAGPARNLGEWVMYGLRVESKVQGVYRPYTPITRRPYEPPWLWQDVDMDRQRVSMESPARPEEEKDTGHDTHHDGGRRARYGRRASAPTTTGFFGLACRHYLENVASLRTSGGGGRGYGGGSSGGQADGYPGRPELLRDLQSGKLFRDLGVRTDTEPLKPHDNYAAYLHGELNPEWVKAHPEYQQVKLHARERDRARVDRGLEFGPQETGSEGGVRVEEAVAGPSGTRLRIPQRSAPSCRGRGKGEGGVGEKNE